MTREEAVVALTERVAVHRFTGIRCSCGWFPDAQRTEREYNAYGYRESRRRQHEEHLLAEILSARVESDCQTCEGVGLVATDGPAGVPHTVSCVECGGSGKSYGSLLVTMATMEQVGYMRPEDEREDGWIAKASPFWGDERDVPVFVESPGEETP